MKKTRLLLTFYKSYAFASNMITLACLYLINFYGSKAIHILQALFWFKILSFGYIFYYIHKYKKDEFYYYKNLGLTEKYLWITTLVFDLIIFITSLSLTLKLQ